ncbi:MAG: rRNA pseudouridine synthase [Aquificae bacterium]|nr:rRNA pseudouridine synthase [Aquificota bacterium]
MKERLNKYIAKSGICSRRKADDLIKQGKVKVNDKIVKEVGIQINPNKDKVYVEGKLIKPIQEKTFIKLYKPRGYLTQIGKDKFGRKTLSDLLQELNIKERVFPVGRLDYDSEGLLILTNDGYIANRLAHPRFKVPKTYIVEVQKRVNLDTFRKMKKGIKLDDGFIKPDELKIVRKKNKSTILEITLHSGKKRVIRRFMEAFGHPVLRLIRTKIGNIKLGDMKEKEWKKIPEKELYKLLDKKGKKL